MNGEVGCDFQYVDQTEKWPLRKVGVNEWAKLLQEAREGSHRKTDGIGLCFVLSVGGKTHDLTCFIRTVQPPY